MKAPVGVILAGGQSRRMGGGDKALLPFGCGTLLDAVIARFAPQVAALALNANGDAARFARFGLPVLADPLPGHPGPLAGVLAAMDWAATQGADAVVTVPADTPFIPCDLAPQLQLSAEGGGMAFAASAGQHPICALWPLSLRGALAAALARDERRVRDFVLAQGPAVARFAPGPPDPFLNVNTPDDLAAAQRWAQGLP
jgi:molybdopterin-guanine dinucleotide biosynthesis protein A